MASSSVMLALTAACSGNSEEGGASGSASSGASAGASAGASNAAQASDNGDPMGKYDPAITVTMVRDMPDNLTFPDGDSMDNNIYTRSYRDELGINLKYDWITDSTQYNEKLNIAITSGELPDIYSVSPVQLKELAEAGQVADLTEVYDKYATPLSKQKFNEDEGIGLKSATFDGKLMALPYVTAAIDGATMLWVRKDWLDKLGLQEPKTIDDVVEIARAFTTKDPDGNGKNDTIGLATGQKIFGGAGGLLAFFNGYHTYPNAWVPDESGQLVNGLIQPATKQALAKLQEMYKEGLIDKEFTTKTGVGPDVIAGKVGMFYGTMSNPLNPLIQSKEKDPKADWQYYPIASNDDQPAKPQISYTPPTYYVVNKNAQHPEALMKLMNYFIEKAFGETADYTYMYQGSNRTHQYAPVRNFGVTKNVDNWKLIKEATASGDAGKLNPEQKGYYDDIQKFKGGDPTKWDIADIFGTDGSLSLVDKYVSSDQLLVDGFYGLPTGSMVEKSGPLGDLALETFTKIILGAPVDNFDKFVADWKKLGGDDITKDVNEWAATQK
ncbi:extracellular solute-binding protein [Cohnella zeiphila]|uniref:Extracellular solute-binding protein n=1 Tax=Cohnella zeiphila TaxID=2761120 RepID=A0A7X0SLG8_9BACL|nr:extracellular solute-binding protein [Cohnella zeiphila]MBB6730890.1 extracellular solute-binding protein [Cohnella zeiphila]